MSPFGNGYVENRWFTSNSGHQPARGVAVRDTGCLAGVISRMPTIAVVDEARDLEAANTSRGVPQDFGGATLHPGIRARVFELMQDARLTNEPLSQLSLADLTTFLEGTPFTKRPAIFLLDNGNFRAVWKNADNEQAAFQFRGDGVVHCVFFYRRASTKLPLSQETLVDLLPNLRDKYPSFERLLHDGAA